MDYIKGFIKSKTAWKDFFLFAVPAFAAYIPSQDDVIREAIASFISSNPWIGFAVFGVGLFLRFRTTQSLSEK